jgi:hypothetical protein
MRRPRTATVLMTGTLVLGLMTLSLAQKDLVPVSVGVVATVVALDAKHALATVQTDTGEVFVLLKGWHWQVGDKIACDRIDAPRPWLQRCRPWQ